MKRQILKTAFALILIFAAVMLISCSSEKKTELSELPYTLDTSLLQEPVILNELQLSARPPLNWNPMDTAKVDMFRKMLAATEMAKEFCPIFPLQVYTDTVAGIMMPISRVEDDQTPFDELAKKYEEFIVPRLKTSGIDKKLYDIEGVKVYQFLVHNDQVVNYKLLGETSAGKRFLIEFIIGGPSFTKLQATVESSIASLSNADIKYDEPGYQKL